MKRIVDEAESSIDSGESSSRPATAGDDPKRAIRDLFALATLPAMWLGAEPQRVAESLLAAIDATSRPELGYIYLSLEAADGVGSECIEVAHVRQRPMPSVAETLRGQLLGRADMHASGEPLLLRDSPVGRPLRVVVQSLGSTAVRGVLALGFAEPDRPSEGDRMVLSMATNQLIVACRNALLQRQAEAAREEAEALHRVTRMLSAELDLDAVLQMASDAARELTRAEFTAFFHNVTNEQGEAYMLYTLSGVPREAFEGFGMPRNTPVFEPTFRGSHVVRMDDVLADPRYGTVGPHYGMPKGHLPVRSYLAVPVISRSGEVLGGLFFGHAQPGIFDERAERIAIGIARQAAIAVDHARLFAKAEQEIRQRKQAEDALRESESILRSFYESAPLFMGVVDLPAGDADIVRIYDSPASLRFFPKAERRPTPVRRMWIERYRESQRCGEPIRFEYLHPVDDKDVWLSVVVTCIGPTESGSTRFSYVAEDISERKEAEHALRDSEERYRRLTEMLPVGVYMCDAPDGTITYFNEQAERAWGRTPKRGDTDERFCGSTALYRPDGAYLPHEECPMAVALREGTSFRNEEVLIERPDGSRIAGLVNIDPIRDANGNVVGAINVFLDVSARKRAQQALREQNENLETLLDTLPVGVLIARDPECAMVVGNRAANELLRRQSGANLSKSAPSSERPEHFRLLRSGEELPLDALPVPRAARGEVVENEEIDIAFDDGTIVHALVSGRPLYDPTGKPRGAVACLLDITEVKNAEQALRKADRRKDEFLATLSHELRNPLAPIRTALAVMREADGDSRRLKLTRDVIGRQVDHMVRLVDDLLDVSRITRDRLELRKETVDLASVVRQAVETCRPIADKDGRAIDVRLPEEPVYVHADPVRLAQVFGNLLHNACKYSVGPGNIEIAAHLEGNGVAVSVADQGIGLAPEHLESIFEMFSQIDAARSRTGSGLGIGLTLVKRLVELHDGSVVANSQGIGCGSEFVVRLPIVAAQESRGASVVSAGTMATPRRILVVDDNRDAAETVGMLLELQGHDVHLAYDGRQALEAARRLRPELVLLDLGLPELDGYEVCRAIRAAAWGKSLVVVALSGWGQAEDRRKTSDAGFDDHLVKPASSAALEKILRELPAPAGP